jgi:CheY-like chemotaxis protein
MSKKILIVDDEKDILVTLQDLLEMEGYNVVCAFNGENALLKLQEEKPDLMITDMMMPVMDGIQLINAVRSSSKQAFIPIILMSATATLLQVENKGWNIFIKKPSDIDILLNSIHDLLKDIEPSL